MKMKTAGMLWTVPVRWLDDLPGAASRILEALPEGHLAHGTNMFTLLDDAAGSFGGVPAGGWVGEISRRQRPAGIRDPGGERRHLFGAGEGLTKAVAEAKQGRTRVFQVPLRTSGSKVGQSSRVSHLSVSVVVTC